MCINSIKIFIETRERSCFHISPSWSQPCYVQFGLLPAKAIPTTNEPKDAETPIVINSLVVTNPFKDISHNPFNHTTRFLTTLHPPESRHGSGTQEAAEQQRPVPVGVILGYECQVSNGISLPM